MTGSIGARMGAGLKAATFAFLFATAMLAPAPAALAQGVITKDAIKPLIASHKGAPPANFRAVTSLVGKTTKNPALTRAIGRFHAGASLAGADAVNLYRMLGVYVRIRHRETMVRTLAELVAIPTDKKEGTPQHENPRIHELGKAISGIAERLGLAFRNFDNRIFEVTLPGSGTGSIGVFTHGDVVPADPAKWVLPDGTRLAPFRLTIRGDRMYGRGASDDKGPIVAALYALGAIKAAGLPLRRTIRLAIETTEETGGSATEYYKARTTLAPYNLVVDGRYPVGVAEKGFGVVMARFPVRAATGEGAEITAATGGAVINQIPASAYADLKTANAPALIAALKLTAAAYVAANGGKFRIEPEARAGGVRVTVIGESSHSARPSRGVNPVPRLFGFIDATRAAGVALKRNHFTDAAAYVAANWGLDYLGGKLGIGYSDPFMGPLTAAVTYVRVKEGALHLAVNPRAPRGREPEWVIGKIRKGLEAWRAKTGTKVTFDIRLKRFMFRDPKGKWIETLLDTFRGVTGVKAGPRSSNGYTSARQLPNGVQFGAGMPGERGTAHKANEFKKMSNFFTDAQILTEAILRLGNLERME
jgi:predicted dipeptidase